MKSPFITTVALSALAAAAFHGANGATPASDHAGDAAYNSGFQAGAQGGTGWGGAWFFTTAGAPSFVTGSSATNGNGDLSPPVGDIDSAPSGRAWGLSVGLGQFGAASRNLAGPLDVGQKVLVDYDNGLGFASSAGMFSFALRNHDGFVLWTFNAGGDSTYAMPGGSVSNPALPAFTDQGLHLEFQLLSATTYSVDVNVLGSSPTTYTGTLLTPSVGDQVIQQLSFSALEIGSTDFQRSYINNLTIAAIPEPGAGLAFAAGAVLFCGFNWRRRPSKFD